jgi:hypothetical protein
MKKWSLSDVQHNAREGEACQKRSLSDVQHNAREGKACQKQTTILWLFCKKLEEGSYLFTIFELLSRERAFMCACARVHACARARLEGLKHLNSRVFAILSCCAA